MSDLSFDADLRGFRQDHQAAKSRLRTLHMVGRILTLVLVVVLVGYLASLYGKAIAMYAPGNFEEPLQEEAQNLLPKLEPELRTLWEQTVPVYAELATARLEEVLPALEEASRRELDTLFANLRTNAEHEVNRALDRISTKHHERLKQHFPNFSSQAGTDEWEARWLDMVQDDLAQVLVHFEKRYLEDLGNLEATFHQFFPNEYERMSEDQLTRQFVHLWLMRVDGWVMTGEKGGES